MSESPFADRLAGCRLEIRGRLVEASNATFLCEAVPADAPTEPDPELAADPESVRTHPGSLLCVYKPVRGEKPLWDFPDGTLAEREVAAYLVSQRCGFDVVPETVMIDGPLGPGSLQLWIELDKGFGTKQGSEPPEYAPELVALVPAGQAPEGWFAVVEGIDAQEQPVEVIHADHPGLRRLALFDAVINNSDRKGAHILAEVVGEGVLGDESLQVWGVDHGVSLHTEDKLRTVLWGWADAELTDEERELLGRACGIGAELEGLITPDEVAALELRCATLLAEGRFPAPSGQWPAIPWPPL